jgi:ElaB/YqjD/DUF883 family membrane-anchored ribosome-binding protein
MKLRDKASAAWSELKQKLQDKENQRRVKEEIEKRLKQGKEAIDRIEKELRDPENQARLENTLRDAKAKVVKAKAEFNRKKSQAVAYTKDNPEKALVVAAAAGALAGALWVAFRRKK